MILKPQRIAFFAMMLLAAALLTAQVMQAQAAAGTLKPAPVDAASLLSSIPSYDVPAPLCTTGSLEVTKVIHWNSCTPVAGQTFSICIQGPSFPTPDCKTFIDPGDLVQTWTNLAPGAYTITETDPGVEWSKWIPVSSVTVNAGITSTAKVENSRKTGTINVRKTVTGSPPDPNQVFQICLAGPAPSTAATCQNFLAGEVKSWTGLAPGDYTISETDPGSDWQVSIDHPNVRINPDGTTNYLLSGSLAPFCTETTVTNNYIKHGKIDVRKVVNWNGAAPDPNKTFKICIAGPSFPSGPDCQSFKDGEEKSWLNLLPSVYTISEENPGEGWTVSIDHPTIRVNPDGTLTWLSGGPLEVMCTGATVTNTLNSGRLTVTKIVDWAGLDPVAGQTFTICIQGPSFPSAPDCKAFVYPDSLVQTWSNLAPGAYTVTEPATGSEWVVTVPDGPVTVSPGGDAQASVTNMHKRQLSLTTTPQPALETVGAILNDSAVLSGGLNPTGSITFKLFPPADTDCTGQPVYTQDVPVDQGNGNYVTSPGYASSQAGTWNWTAGYSGDAANSPAASACKAEMVTIKKAGPALNTLPSPGSGPVGVILNDTAELRSGFAPTGSVLFNLYPPSDAACERNPIYSQVVPVDHGNGSYATTPGIPSNAAGTWRWTAAYGGDQNNAPAASGCQDEMATVTKANASITTVPNPATGIVGDVLNDMASLTGTFNPTGTILFKLFPPSDTTCTGAAVYSQAVDVNGSGDYHTSPGYTSDQAGVWNWTAHYSGDANNNQASSGCTLEQVTITFKPGSVTIKKHVDWNGVPPITGQTFEICLTGPDALPVSSCKTFTAEQVQSWDNLAPGTYFVSEPDPGSAWNVTINPTSVLVTPDGKPSVDLVTVTNSRKLGKLEVTKVVDWNGIDPNPAVSFQICITGPSYPQAASCKTFNATNGWTQAWDNLIPGDYSLRETFPGNEWKVTVSSAVVTVPVNGEKATAQVINQRKLGSLTVTKTVSWNGVTPIQGQAFTICLQGASYPLVPSCKTFTYPDTLSQTWVNLIPGNYRVTEPDAGAEWQVQISTSLVVIPIDGSLVQVEITNTRKLGSLQVVKTVDWLGIKKPALSFTICIQGPSFPATPDCKEFSNSAGWIQTWLNLIPGSYIVSEEDPGLEWNVTVPDGPVTVPADGGQATANVTNTYKPGKLIVVKSVDWGNAVPDPAKTYEICVTGPSYPSPDCKNASYMGSTLTWENLFAGQYSVSETDPGLIWNVKITGAPGYVRPGGYATVLVQNRTEETTGVSLVSFTAARLPQQSVRLAWRTTVEKNLAGFMLYRSNSSDFSARLSIGFVQSTGGGTSYEFIDTPPANGCWFYWLVYIDTNANQFVAQKANALVGKYFSFLPVLNK